MGGSEPNIFSVFRRSEKAHITFYIYFTRKNVFHLFTVCVKEMEGNVRPRARKPKNQIRCHFRLLSPHSLVLDNESTLPLRSLCTSCSLYYTTTDLQTTMVAAKTPMRLLCEEWLLRNPYCLGHDVFQINGCGFTRTEICQVYYDWVRARLVDENGALLYPEETTKFSERIRATTKRIRAPLVGIIRDRATERSLGDVPATHYSEVKKLMDNNPQHKEYMRGLWRKCTDTYRNTPHGQVVEMLHAEKRRDVRKGKCSIYAVQSLGRSAAEIGKLCIRRFFFVFLCFP